MSVSTFLLNFGYLLLKAITCCLPDVMCNHLDTFFVFHQRVFGQYITPVEEDLPIFAESLLEAFEHGLTVLKHGRYVALSWDINMVY